MRTQWTTKGNRDAGSSCSCNRGLHRYLAEYLRGILMVLIHTSVNMLTYVVPWREKKNTTVGVIAGGGGLFTKQLKKWVKAVFFLGCYGCTFHGTGNSAQHCQNFGISGVCVCVEPPPHPVCHWDNVTVIHVFHYQSSFSMNRTWKFEDSPCGFNNNNVQARNL